MVKIELAKSGYGKSYRTNNQVSSINKWHGGEGGERETAGVQKRLGNISTKFKVWNVLGSRFEQIRKVMKN